MPVSPLVRSGALCAALAGPLMVVATVLHPDEFEAGALVDPAWVPVHLVMGTAFALTVPGVLALAAVGATGWGRLGRAAPVVATAGAILAFTITAIEALALPAFARATSPRPLMDLLSADLPGVAALFGVGVPTWILGFVLLGVAIARAGVLPRGAGVALAVGSVALAIPVHFVGGAAVLVKLAASLTYGGALSRLGLAAAGVGRAAYAAPSTGSAATAPS